MMRYAAFLMLFILVACSLCQAVCGEDISRASEVSAWKIDEDLKFHLGYYSELQRGRYAYCPRSLGLTKDYLPDITNINLKNFLDLGFPVPSEEHPESYNFFLKFYEYPKTLNSWLSVRKILDPFLVLKTGSGEALKAYLGKEGSVVVKKGFIDLTSRIFDPSHPFPPLTVFAPVVESKVTLSPQDDFDSNILFSSLYVKPVSGTGKSARESSEGVMEFHREILSLYGKAFSVMKAPAGDKTFFFLDDSGCDSVRGSQCSVNVIRVPENPMRFDNFRDLPMPQNPQSIFLTGLLLIYIDTYRIDTGCDSANLQDFEWLRAHSVKTYSHVLEIGSVIDLSR